MASIQCPKCGTLEDESARQCAACGTSLEGRPPVSDPEAIDTSGSEFSPEAAAEAAKAQALAAQAQAQAMDAGRTATKSPSRYAAAIEAIAPFTTALVGTLLLQFLISNFVSPDLYIYRLFRPPGGWVMGLVPGLITFVFIWTMMDLAFKYRTGLINESDLERREIRQLPRMVAQEPVGVTQRRLVALDGRERPVVRRLLWLLHYLESNADAQRTHELLRHQSDLDADTGAAGYRTVKLFIWAMPILGFVGTVLGISLAVGGFSNFLTTNLDIDDVSKVTAELGNVASGLSFAFDTTLLGLLGGLVANVFSSNVQKRDERFFTRLDELGLSIVANRRGVGSMALDAVGPVGDGGTAFEARMRARIDELTSVIARTQEVMDGLSSTSSRMNSGLTESIGAVRRTVHELGTNLEGVAEALAGSMADLGTQVNVSHGHFAEGLTGLQDALQQTQQQSLAGSESQASVERAVQQLTSSIEEFGAMLAEFKSEQSALTPVLTQLAGPLEIRLVPATRSALPPGSSGPPAE